MRVVLCFFISFEQKTIFLSSPASHCSQMARIGFTYLSPKCSNCFLLSVFFAAGFTNFDQQLAQVGNGQDGQDIHHGQDGQCGQDGKNCTSPVLIR